MSQPRADQFACDACGKSFAWKDNLAGRRVRCKCGNVFVATLAPGDVASHQTTHAAATRTREEADEIALYPDPDQQHRQTLASSPRPSPLSSPPLGERAGAHAGAVTTAVPKAVASVYPGRSRRVVVQEEGGEDDSPWRDRYVPIMMAAAGLLGWVVMTVAYPLANLTPGKALAVAGVMLLANVVSLVIGVFVAAALLGMNFGAMRTAVLKLLAIALFVGAVFFLCVRIDYPKDIRGAIVGIHVAVLLYWTFFATLFDLELQETLITAAIVGLVQSMAGCVVMKV